MSFASALEELASLFHRIATAQAVPAATAALDDPERIAAYAGVMSPEAVQLAYQICVQGRADLALAPDEATGFAMTLLRLLAFEPGGDGRPASSGNEAARRAAPPRPAATAATATTATVAVLPAEAVAATPQAEASSPRRADASVDAGLPARSLPTDPAAWPAFVAGLKLGGIVGQLAAQTELVRCAGRELVLRLPETQRHLTDKSYSDKLKAALDEAAGVKLRLTFELSSVADASLAAQEKRERAEQKAKTEAAFRDEPFVRDVLSRFDAKIKPDSIKPVS